MIIFIGDKPSKKNVDPSIPFVGTQSYKRLLMWIWEMDLDITNIGMCNKDQIPTFYGDQAVYVALGRNAQKVAEQLDLTHYFLPHPSGLNRTINDKALMKQLLKKCKEWINENR